MSKYQATALCHLQEGLPPSSEALQADFFFFGAFSFFINGFGLSMTNTECIRFFIEVYCNFLGNCCVQYFFEFPHSPIKAKGNLPPPPRKIGFFLKKL